MKNGSFPDANVALLFNFYFAPADTNVRKCMKRVRVCFDLRRANP